MNAEPVWSIERSSSVSHSASGWTLRSRKAMNAEISETIIANAEISETIKSLRSRKLWERWDLGNYESYSIGIWHADSWAPYAAHLFQHAVKPTLKFLDCKIFLKNYKIGFKNHSLIQTKPPLKQNHRRLPKNGVTFVFFHWVNSFYDFLISTPPLRNKMLYCFPLTLKRRRPAT